MASYREHSLSWELDVHRDHEASGRREYLIVTKMDQRSRVWKHAASSESRSTRIGVSERVNKFNIKSGASRLRLKIEAYPSRCTFLQRDAERRTSLSWLLGCLAVITQLCLVLSVIASPGAKEPPAPWFVIKRTPITLAILQLHYCRIVDGDWASKLKRVCAHSLGKLNYRFTRDHDLWWFLPIPSSIMLLWFTHPRDIDQHVSEAVLSPSRVNVLIYKFR